MVGEAHDDVEREAGRDDDEVEREDDPHDARSARGLLRLGCRRWVCRWSGSRGRWSSSFDSGEPRWSSHTVNRIMSVNWRYSDCQFSITSTPKSDETR